jgi:hypothetical protein
VDRKRHVEYRTVRMTKFARFADLYAWYCFATRWLSPKVVSRSPTFSGESGGWSCDGQFISSEKKISADSLSNSLDGMRILLRHDDRLTFKYQALSEWGWDAKAQGFVSIIEDSSGGLRVFRAKRFDNGRITWDGGLLGDSASMCEQKDDT